MLDNTKKIRFACYGANITMAVVGNMPSLLFLTFREKYHISFSLLGTLVLINFATQLLIDLAFSFFSHKFSISKAVKISPLLATVGLLFYAAAPFLFPNSVYVGLALGTVIFSAASGFNEVLISPVAAALPSKNPDRDMSNLHSVYAWGAIGVIVVSTLFLLIFGNEYWFVLPILFTVIPVFSAIMFFGSTLPPLEKPQKVSGALKFLKNKTLLMCVAAIFVGGACELVMTQWCSSYLEQALGIKKVWGDIFGVAAFAFTLGLGRTLYGKFGKNIERVLLLSAIGAAACYLICIISPLPILGLFACALTGLCVAMMWPGSLVVAAKRITAGGVFVYAMMAAGGDLGAAVAPLITGVVTDAVTQNAATVEWALTHGMTAEQLAMKLGMGVGFIFSLFAVLVFLYVWRTKDKKPLYIEN